MWKKIIINANLIKAATERAILIAMPHNSDYDGYSFWHPSKLCREGNGETVSISFTNEFVFLLKKYGSGKYNKWEILDEIPLSGEDMESVFAELNEHFIPPEEPLVYTPEHREPEHATADESLIDND